MHDEGWEKGGEGRGDIHIYFICKCDFDVLDTLETLNVYIHDTKII